VFLGWISMPISFSFVHAGHTITPSEHFPFSFSRQPCTCRPFVLGIEEKRRLSATVLHTLKCQWTWQVWVSKLRFFCALFLNWISQNFGPKGRLRLFNSHVPAYQLKELVSSAEIWGHIDFGRQQLDLHSNHCWTCCQFNWLQLEMIELTAIYLWM
jgi:hypothetical protein